MLESLQAAANQLDSEGKGELSEEELCTVINQMDQLQISLQEVPAFFSYNLMLKFLEIIVCQQLVKIL
jgi:hypothetical protein